MKKWILLLLVALFVVPVSESAFAAVKKKKKKGQTVAATTAKPILPKESKYDKLFKKKSCETVKSDFVTLHKVDGKVYFEIPVKYMEREMLLASVVSESSDNSLVTIGYKEQDPLHIKFVKIDSAVQIRRVNTYATYDKVEEGLKKAYENNFQDAVLFHYPVVAFNKDSSAVVIDVTPLFMGNVKSLAAVPSVVGGVIKLTSNMNTAASSLGQIKAFDDNLSVKSNFSFTVSGSYMGMAQLFADEPLTVTVTRSLLLLPEKKMHPRVSDSRIGIFLTPKQHISLEEDQLQDYCFANRWRLEPKDMATYQRGELVEPVKPVVYYLDDAFPESWKQPLREGVLRWNAAFEKIGFKNAIQVRDFPKDDPSFDPDNLKYSCIRYTPASVANAMGPSWVDPSTGEIINASVIVYNDIVKLINNWRFVQTAQVDPSVRGKKMPKEIMDESITYVLAHEIGHTLGLMHNMAASAAYSVDSLRSSAFTLKHGTTPSIMDYARFNYVAQPQDAGVRLTPPDLGVYDFYAIEWLYKPVKAAGMREEMAILESWVDRHAGDPRYRYGKQQLASRYDPTALEEDLGDDAMKAGEYGIKNLKYITARMNDWITNDTDFSHRKGLMMQIVNQYYRYIKNVMINTGGIYLSEVKDGTPGQRYQSVPKAIQKAALAWTMKQLKSCDWLDKTGLVGNQNLQISNSALLRDVLVADLMNTYKNVILSSHVSVENPYVLSEYFDDFYDGVWGTTMNGGKLTAGDKAMQTAMVNQITEAFGDKGGGGMGLSFGRRLTNVAGAFVPSVDELYAYGVDPTGVVKKYINELRELESEYGRGFVAHHLKTNEFGYGYAWQRAVEVKAIDDSKGYLYVMGGKIRSLLSSKVSTGDAETRAHYQNLLYSLDKALKK